MTVLGLLVASFITQGQPFLPTFSTLIKIQPEKVQQRLISNSCLSTTSHQPSLSAIKFKYHKTLNFSPHEISGKGSHSSIERLERKSNFSPVLKTVSLNAKPFVFSEESLGLTPRIEWDMPQTADYYLERRLLAQYYRGQQLPVLRYGNRGNAVRVLQTLLTYNRYGVAVTGRFDVLTETAVKAFQANRRLGVDGIVGSRTWRELTRYAVFKSKRNPMEIPMFSLEPVYPWHRSFRENSAESPVSI